jgi:hypothetical protein
MAVLGIGCAGFVRLVTGRSGAACGSAMMITKVTPAQSPVIRDALESAQATLNPLSGLLKASGDKGPRYRALELTRAKIREALKEPASS